MAILKLMKYKNRDDHHASRMQSLITYCLQPEKTEQEDEIFSTAGQNCVPGIAYEQFMLTKQIHGKTDGVFFKHYVQSFSPEENITPDIAMKIAEEFADCAWHGYQVLIATHTDREHIHTHFVVNTVHPETGKKLVEHTDNIENLRKLSDEICRAHGLSTLPPYESQRLNTMGSGEYRSAERRDSWKIRLRKAICKSMEWSFTNEEFIENMNRLGYSVRWEDSRKNITYTCRNEPKYKNGNYRKCNDDKLNDDKYLKGSMEYEFKIRTETFFGTADGRRKSRNTRRNTDGTDCGERLDKTADNAQAVGNADHGGENRTPDADRSWGEIPLGDEEIGAGAKRNGEGRNPETRESVGRTGWERERESLSRNRTPNDSGRVPLVAPSAANGTSGATHSRLGGLYGLASAVTVIDNGAADETDEEKKEREARETGSAIGAGIGILLGAVTAIKATQTAERTAAEQVPDEEKTPADADENAFDISM